MNPVVKRDILAVLEKVVRAVKEQDVVVLAELSNHVIHDASIFQDGDSTSFAILVYALSKTVQRCCQGGLSTEKFQEVLGDAYTALKHDDEARYAARIHSLFNSIQATDNRLKLYVEQVISKARIKKGSELYKHGISVARTAEILGISQWDLLNYVGKTFIAEMTPDEDVRQRVKFARGLFRA